MFFIIIKSKMWYTLKWAIQALSQDNMGQINSGLMIYPLIILKMHVYEIKG